MFSAIAAKKEESNKTSWHREKEQFYIEKYQTKTGIIGQEVSSTNKGNKINSFDKSRVDPRGKAFKAEYDDIVANHNKKIAPNNFH